MKRSLAHLVAATVAGAVLLSGCETMNQEAAPAPAAHPPAPPAPHRAPPPAATPVIQAPVMTPEQSALHDGIELYNKGAYSDAIKRLAAPDITGASRPTQVQALKYTAFSYCVTSRMTLCRMAFEKAFRLDPAFDLLPGEHGHPLWGPVFAKAKKAK